MGGTHAQHLHLNTLLCNKQRVEDSSGQLKAPKWGSWCLSLNSCTSAACGVASACELLKGSNSSTLGLIHKYRTACDGGGVPSTVVVSLPWRWCPFHGGGVPSTVVHLLPFPHHHKTEISLDENFDCRRLLPRLSSWRSHMCLPGHLFPACWAVPAPTYLCHWQRDVTQRSGVLFHAILQNPELFLFFLLRTRIK